MLSPAGPLENVEGFFFNFSGFFRIFGKPAALARRLRGQLELDPAELEAQGPDPSRLARAARAGQTLGSGKSAAARALEGQRL